MPVGNGRWESTQFNSRLQLTQIALGTVQNGTDKLKLNYDYGTTANNGNVLAQTIIVPTVGANAGFTAIQTYSYDSLNRLKDAKENINGNPTPSWKQTFTFDRYGNRNFDTANTTTLGNCPVNVCNPSINPVNNRFTTGQGYTFDLAGNVITDAQGRSFNYDAENKQKEVRDVNNAVVGQYLYDGDGKRAKKVSNTETVIFVYDAGGKLVAEYSNQTTQQPQVSYLTNDNLGTPRITTDANGNVISRHDYLPFSEEVFTAQRTQGLNYTADNLRQGFVGYERDNESELDFAEARYYNSKHGRFTTTDPVLMSKDKKLNPQEINLYAYCKNNPLAYVDPSGEIVDWANKDSKKFYDEYKKYVNSLSDDNADKAGLLATLKQLEESGVTYVINVTTQIEEAGGEVEGRVNPDEKGEKIMVNIRNLGNKHEEWSLNSRFAHELTHAQQFNNGEIGFYKDSKTGKWSVTPGSYDSFDEVNAYRASVAIGVTNGNDNLNPKLRQVISGFSDAKGDRNKELEAYRRYRNLDDKDLIRQNNIVRYPDRPSGLLRFEYNKNLILVCNGGCPKK